LESRHRHTRIRHDFLPFCSIAVREAYPEQMFGSRRPRSRRRPPDLCRADRRPEQRSDDTDEAFRLTDALRLPTFEAAGQRLLRRLTLLITDGIVEHVWYPVFPPDTHAQEVLRWLQARRATAS